MRKELKIFCNAPENKKQILANDKKFFSGKDAEDDEEPRLHQILASDKLTKACWKENVAELKEGTGKKWKKVVASFEAAQAEDDD